MPAIGSKETRARGRSVEMTLRVLALLLAFAGPVAYYYEISTSRFVRLALLFGAWILAVLVFALSSAGRVFWQFLRDARVELRKVVWPTRPQYLQTTGFVIVMVIVLSLMLWIFDLGLGAIMRLLTVGG